jgi:hypothetical protein
MLQANVAEVTRYSIQPSVRYLPVIRMNQLVPLQKLFMFETFPTLVADKPPPIVVLCFLMIHYRTGMIQ